MDIMRILKIAFVILLCLPVAYIAYILIDQLLDQARQSTGTPKKKAAGRKTSGKKRKK